MRTSTQVPKHRKEITTMRAAFSVLGKWTADGAAYVFVAAAVLSLPVIGGVLASRFLPEGETFGLSFGVFIVLFLAEVAVLSNAPRWISVFRNAVEQEKQKYRD